MLISISLALRRHAWLFHVVLRGRLKSGHNAQHLNSGTTVQLKTQVTTAPLHHSIPIRFNSIIVSIMMNFYATGVLKRTKRLYKLLQYIHLSGWEMGTSWGTEPKVHYL